MKRIPGNFEEILKHSLPSATDEQMEPALDRIHKRLQSDGRDMDFAPSIDFSSARKLKTSRWMVMAAAAVLIATIWIGIALQHHSAYAVLETANGSLVRVLKGNTVPIHRGGRIEAMQIVRSNGGTGAIVVLTDGSRVEMRAQSELSLERADDGVRIRLISGGVIVNAAKQSRGHLYVQTKDVTVSVVGTVFLVNVEQEGSRVAVIQGEVHVEQGTTSRKLLPGEQVATNPVMEWQSVSEESSWSRNATLHLALLQQSTPPQSVVPPIGMVAKRPPEFETASIRASKSTEGSDSDMGPGYLRLSGSLVSFIRIAFGVRPDEIEGGPKWLDQDRYDIEARAAGPAARPELLDMLQALLKDRFKLDFHWEKKFFPGYALVVGKNGLSLRMKEVSPGDSRSHDVAGVMTAEKMTMARLAKNLSSKLRMPVTDETGLSGAFDFKLEYVPDFGTPLLTAGDVKAGTSADPSILYALQDQLGLKLEPRPIQSEVIVVDSASKPSPN